MSYNVHLEKFEGPLDLLLHLIKKNEIDIYDIPVSQITKQYTNYIRQWKEMDLEIASEFIVMAAKLIQIKSLMLLPPEENEEEDQIDPREELIQKLLEYKIFKEISVHFKKEESTQLKAIYKDPEYFSELERNVVHTEIKLEDIYKAIKNIIARNEIKIIEDNKVHNIERDIVTVKEKISEINKILETRDTILFSQLLNKSMLRHEFVISFLAILELIKLNFVSISQKKQFDEIIITKV